MLGIHTGFYLSVPPRLVFKTSRGGTERISRTRKTFLSESLEHEDFDHSDITWNYLPKLLFSSVKCERGWKTGENRSFGRRSVAISGSLWSLEQEIVHSDLSLVLCFVEHAVRVTATKD